MPTDCYRLQPTPNDSVTAYTLWRNDQRLGEIRKHDMHASALYLGERALWLRHDEGADVAARGGSWLGRFVAELRFSRNWSLRDGDRVLARAQRRWHWSPARDLLLLWPEPVGDPITASSPRAIGRELALQRDHRPIGRMRIAGLLQHRIELECEALDPACAALFMYAMHIASSAHRGGGGSDDGWNE